jgi:hypothetical protein
LKTDNIVFESYNNAYSKSFNNYFDNCESEDFLRNKEDENKILEEFFKIEIGKWENTPLSQLNGLTPACFFENIDDFDYLIELFKVGARIVDTKLPDLFLKKLKAYGDRSNASLIELATNKVLISNEYDISIPQMAMRILGKWKIEKAIEPLLELLYSLHDKDELIAEEISDALSDIGMLSIKTASQRLEAAQKIGFVEEHLLSLLTYTEDSLKSDDILKCLKSTFRKMDNKILGSMYLADYGDGRAIPALRGYVEKNIETIDRDTFYAIKSAIEMLGGNIDDIQI